MARVIDLEIGDEFRYAATTLFVRAIDHQHSKVIATKEHARLPHGSIGIGFYSSDHEDLCNRVELTGRRMVEKA